MTQAQLKEFAVKNSWNTLHSKSNGLDGPHNYSGPNHGDMVVVIGQNRDSDILSQSNFLVALDMLGGESKNVEVVRIGHWGCGWFELIMINPASKKHLKIAYDIKKKLDDYPVLDESDYSEREFDRYSEYAEGAKKDLANALVMHFGVKYSKILEKIAYDLNIEDQCYSGEDSCIDIYDCRKPDARGMDDLKRAMSEISYNYKTSKAFKRLQKAIEVYKIEE